jgi:CBS domain-containing protein
MKVKDVMHKGVDWVSPNTPVTELAKLMRGHDIGCIPIGEDDRLIGMVTDRDIVCKGLASNNFDAGRATARDVMTEGIHCCREDDDLAKAVHHMEKMQLRRLPVINESKRMVGMVSLGDISHSASGDLLSECIKSARHAPSDDDDPHCGVAGGRGHRVQHLVRAGAGHRAEWGIGEGDHANRAAIFNGDEGHGLWDIGSSGH